MRRLFYICICLLPAFWSCNLDIFRSDSVDTGTIRIVVGEETGTLKDQADSSSVTPKPAAPAELTELEVRVLKSDGSPVTSKTLYPVFGYFEGTLSVKAQDNLKVLFIGKNNSVVERFGMDDDVDVKAGETATAEIPGTQWYTSYVPVITSITPNPSVDGSYTVTWSQVPLGTTYILQEAQTQDFSDGYTVHSGAETQKDFSGKGEGIYHYHIMASNTFNVSSGWSGGESVEVSAPGTVYTISGAVYGADAVTVTLSGDAEGSLVVSDGGTYSFNVAAAGTYTVTPSQTGYRFEPSSSSYSNIISNQTQNFTGILAETYTISGTVTGADGVAVKLFGGGGDVLDSLVVNSGGTYSFTVTHGGTYTITPSRRDFKFIPASKTFSDVTSNQIQNFAGEKPSVPATLTVKVNDTSGGTVTPAPGTHTYDSGELVTIAAEPAERYRFAGWNGNVADATSPTTTVTMTGDQTVTANFEKIPVVRYTLTMTVNQTGWGTTTPAAGTHQFNKDTEVTIVAEPASGYRFVGWEGEVADPASPSTTVVMTGNKAVTAIFKEIQFIPVMVPIPSGIFQMGSTTGNSNEQPVHMVNINVTDFQMSETEITQAQYKHVTGDNPSHFTGNPDLPVEQVSWFDAVSFCNQLSDADGFQRCYDEATWKCDFTRDGYRLPTEAEWEYACRAGTTTEFYSGDTEDELAAVGWYSGNSEGMTHPVGEKIPNDFGLFDMHGNVWEWCNDWYGPYPEINSTNPTGPPAGVYRVVRGGSWLDAPNNASSGYRAEDEMSTDAMYPNTGFRVVRGTFKPGHTISGTVTGADGVTVTLSGDISSTQLVNDGGTYTFPVNAGGSYTVTPSKAGYAFTPPNQTFTNVAASQVQDFTATPITITYTISGKITGTDSTLYLGPDYLIVSLSGDANDSKNVGPTGSYSFTVNEGGNYTVTPSKAGYTFNPPSKTFSNLTSGQTQNFVASANISREGKILFHSTRDGNYEIYVMNADGSNQTRLTNNSSMDMLPSWSPDGFKIVFCSDRDGNREIYIMDADGSNKTRLTNNSAIDASPSFSPDGSLVVYNSNRDGNAETYVMNADGTNQIRLTNNLASDGGPSWLPDGSKIIFSSTRDGKYQIYVMNPDGSNQTNLTNHLTSDNENPSWSPDGSNIAFYSNRDGNNEIYIMNADGSNQKRLTNTSNVDDHPSWSPDGSKIAYDSRVEPGTINDIEIYVINADGSNLTNLTNNSVFDQCPAWSPF